LNQSCICPIVDLKIASGFEPDYQFITKLDGGREEKPSVDSKIGGEKAQEYFHSIVNGMSEIINNDKTTKDNNNFAILKPCFLKDNLTDLEIYKLFENLIKNQSECMVDQLHVYIVLVDQ
jgi:hypothetical protein